VSEGGLALTHFGSTAAEGVVTVQFMLPSAQPQTFQAKAAVVSTDAYAMGLRFSVSSLAVVQVSRRGWILWRHNCDSGN
jgi:hypothetical protein